jgi:hypothetical protein
LSIEAREQIGTHSLFVAARPLVDPADPQAVRHAHALQAALTIRQQSPGRVDVPNADPVSQEKVREAL